MKLTILSLLALGSDAVLSLEAKCLGSDPLTVRTSTGTYTGLIDPKFSKTRQFRAIPFAKPPVLSRRWLPPQKLSSPPSEHHYATRFPPSCPQFVTAVTSLWNQNLTKGNLIYNGQQNDSSGLVGEATSEDCLYLAIWTPTAAAPPAAAGLPVLFFMTGGGFVIGGVDIPWQLPPSWVERSQSHIVVTINYRLNIFGFPNARGLADGHQNLGILDQRAALEWVRDNIAAFGGDPARITLWGQSAGSIGADYHAYAFYQDPIAQAYFMQSGTVFSTSPPQDPTHSNFSFVARHVGCEAPSGGDDDDDDEDGAAELDCMRRVSFAQIENFIGQYGDRGKTPALSFNVIPDDRIVFSDCEARSEAGKIARAPAIISNTANEWSSLVPYPVDNLTTGPYQPAVTAGDISFGVCPTFNSTVYRNRMDLPVFRFQHAGTFPNLNHLKWLGAYHASDLPIIFGTYGLLDDIANTTRFEVEVSQSMQDHVLAFVKDPFRGPQKTMGWMPLVASDPHGGDLIRFGADGKVSQHVNGIEVDGLALDLASIFPVKEVAERSFQKFIAFASELRKSGSDIVVEANLAEVFGRGNISSELEQAFKSKVAVQNIKPKPLFDGSTIELREGPGPTLLRAFEDKTKIYMSTVITLSMLSSFQNTEDLATTIDWALNKRFEIRMPESSQSPGYEGILGTLQSCSSQYSEFLWKDYIDRIEAKLQSSIPNIIIDPDSLRLTPTVFLGAIDFLYAAQRWPEARKVTVSIDVGCVPLIIWAHYVLGMTVVVSGCPKGDVVFSNGKEDQVFITWEGRERGWNEQEFLPTEREDIDPTIRLLDSESNIILACEPDEEGGLTSRVDERHPLRGYGTTYLRRLFNLNFITMENEPIYPEAVGLITGLALSASSRMGRDVCSDARVTGQDSKLETVAGEDIQLESWRVLESAVLIFSGLPVDESKASTYEEVYSRQSVNYDTLPSALYAFLRKVGKGHSYTIAADGLIREVRYLAKIVLLFAHVVELQKCAMMPLIMKQGQTRPWPFAPDIIRYPRERGFIRPTEVFHGIVRLLSSTVLDNSDDRRGHPSRTQFLFLCSDFGWSVYLNTVGKLDPADVRPELIRIGKGVPTNKKTNERKLRIRDGVRFRKMARPACFLLKEGQSYTPRAATKNSHRREFYASRSQEFELTIYVVFEFTSELQQHAAGHWGKFDQTFGYRKMQEVLWQALPTPECEHNVRGQEVIQSPREIEIGPDAVALFGYSNDEFGLRRKPYWQKLIIFLTRGDPNLRWAALNSLFRTSYEEDRHRNTMLQIRKSLNL
ncbi:MAG: hypothetical protein Q9157_002965 [Trypethelium eluteriae]